MSTITFPANSVLIESSVNATEGYRFYENEQPLKNCMYCNVSEDDTIAVNKGKLFKMLVNEYGRCVGRVYVDVKDGTISTGWVFEKRESYSDCKETYLQRTWVTFATVTPKTYSHLKVA